MIKLYEGNKHVHKYLKKAIQNEDIELEVIFGITPYKNPLDKPSFMRVLSSCKEYFELIMENSSLDIRCTYEESKLSNVRVSINGMDNIKKYCKTDQLDNLDSVEYIQKSYYKDNNEPRFKYFALKEQNYNVRMNLKKEIKLD